MLRFLLPICVGLFLFCFGISNEVEAIVNDNQLNIEQKTIEDINLDKLLGEDINFPFDPANHRDGSNPIKRIGSIRDENL